MEKTVTLSMTLTFSEGDYNKAKYLLAYSLADEKKTLPDDSFFVGRKEPIDLYISKLMAGEEPGADQMCLAMMLFMVASEEEPKKNAWQQRVEEKQKKNPS